VPKLEYLGLLGHVWFQQDGAPAHCIIIVRELWPSRSPDLSSCDKALQDSSNRRLLKSGTGHLRNLKKLFGMHLFPLLQQCCAGRHTACTWRQKIVMKMAVHILIRWSNWHPAVVLNPRSEHWYKY
jgi:hypothetical protein